MKAVVSYRIGIRKSLITRGRNTPHPHANMPKSEERKDADVSGKTLMQNTATA